jgi:protein phosphatase
VGDSRAYIADGRAIVQITNDHSLVAERMEDGSITEDEARTSGARHIITRSVGSMPEVDVDVFGPLQLQRGSTLLLCSDGLTDVVDDGLLQEILRSPELDQAAAALIDAANANGGPDNISLILYRGE